MWGLHAHKDSRNVWGQHHCLKFKIEALLS